MTCGRKDISLTLRTVLISVCLLMGQLPMVEAKNSEPEIENYASEREQALELFAENRWIEALPTLKKLYNANPDDLAVLEALAWSSFAHAATIMDKEIRKKAMKSSRDLAVKAKEMGTTSAQVQSLLLMPVDGGDPPKGSGKNQVEVAMMEGEAAFAQGDSKKAIASYEHALQLNPKHYEAALYIGDVYYKQNEMNKAAEWFAKAIAIDPERETAYRYWGDALLSANKKDESLEKFIDAVIAEPYSRYAYNGMANWSLRYGKKLGHPRLDVPMSSSYDNKNKAVHISVMPSNNKDAQGVWLTYSFVRAVWQSEKKFKEEFPDEKQYRHSLREESDALRRTAEFVLQQLKSGKLKKSPLDVSIENLLKLHAAELIEAYVLLVKADDGIGQDYSAYRKENREKLRKYLAEVVINGGVINNGI